MVFKFAATLQPMLLCGPIKDNVLTLFEIGYDPENAFTKPMRGWHRRELANYV
jgi:hypothetical protein